MQRYSAMKCLCAVTCIMIVVATVTSAAPSYADYDNNIRDLWEILLQKEAMDDKFAPGGPHQMVRKSGRSPSLRLRFGRRSDASMTPEAAFMMAQAVDHETN
ncbi:short neuropeptide F [Tribolium castaneum]|uniref:Short neuropeptide F n=2 Tax=Tribolium castaneum TaxID=7070 RepID=D6X455_TRICA|nr:PREDICTED: short neuropeptide F [Tribolium castaneum]EEZ97763.1 short neuropeptide F [Tribolium castaneum]|eukprot:XP_008198705.1 PREDICTED: short neuropeptide F [Tribolium castaneum]